MSNSVMSLDQIIRAVQEALGVNGDGKPGPETWQAIYDRICPDAQPPEPLADKVDDRSERVIATLLPEVQPYARALIAKAVANSITIKVISGLRTYRRTERPLRARANQARKDRNERAWRVLQSQFWNRLRHRRIRRQQIPRRLA